MDDDLKSFNQRKRESLKINKNNKKKCRYHDIKSNQKVNKLIRMYTRCSLAYSLNNDNVDNFILPIHTPKSSLNWWDCDPYKIKIY